MLEACGVSGTVTGGGGGAFVLYLSEFLTRRYPTRWWWRRWQGGHCVRCHGGYGNLSSGVRRCDWRVGVGLSDGRVLGVHDRRIEDGARVGGYGPSSGGGLGGGRHILCSSQHKYCRISGGAP